jgi:protein-S-isoprenylcysteine O-methyltransferase Ste14
VYAAGIVLGWLLDRWEPLPITSGRSPVRELVAAAFLLVFAAIVGMAFVSFRRAQTTVIPGRAANALVTSGPYRITRNPMYVSFVALYIGVTLLINTWWPLPLLPCVVVVIDRVVIRDEEHYLALAFPREYAAYRSRVRRWL